MFEYAESFNQPIGNWNVSKVKSAACMFNGAKSFNQYLSAWVINDAFNYASVQPKLLGK